MPQCEQTQQQPTLQWVFYTPYFYPRDNPGRNPARIRRCPGPHFYHLQFALLSVALIACSQITTFNGFTPFLAALGIEILKAAFG